MELYRIKLGQKENKFCLYTLGPDFKVRWDLTEDIISILQM